MYKNFETLPGWLVAEIAAVQLEAELEVEKQAQELFGDSEDCTDDEFDIIFSSELSHAEKVAALKVMRGKTLVGS